MFSYDREGELSMWQIDESQFKLSIFRDEQHRPVRLRTSRDASFTGPAEPPPWDAWRVGAFMPGSGTVQIDWRDGRPEAWTWTDDAARGYPREARFGYNGEGKLERVDVGQPRRPPVQTYTWRWKDGHPRSHPSGGREVLTYAFNEEGRQTRSERIGDDGKVNQWTELQYDGDVLARVVTDTPWGHPTGRRERTFLYDDQNRLIKEIVSGASSDRPIRTFETTTTYDRQATGLLHRVSVEKLDGAGVARVFEAVYSYRCTTDSCIPGCTTEPPLPLTGFESWAPTVEPLARVWW